MSQPTHGAAVQAGEHDMLPGLRASVADSRAKAAATRRRNAETWTPAAVDPVARVLLELPLAHLDRPYDYAVPDTMDAAARPGVRVKVRFAGQEADGFIVERRADTDHTGQLRPLKRVVGTEPVLSPEVAELTGLVAQRWAGTRGDVLRLAVPPRHATTEAEPSPQVPFRGDGALQAALAAWRDHVPGGAFLEHLAGGGAPRAVWSAAPSADWPLLLAHAAAAALSAGRGALMVVPDAADVARVSAALEEVIGSDQFATLVAGLGPAARYREFLQVSRGAARVVVGTRAAAYAPVRDLGLVAIWDDADPVHAEPRAPYPHARDVLLLRAQQQGCAALVGAVARSVEADHLVTTGWAHEIAAPRARVRELVRVEVAGASTLDLDRDPYARASRVPRQAHRAIGAGLERGPVLVQTPRTGYLASLACERCRTPARCADCAGPLHVPSATAAPTCRWCGHTAPAWACPTCHHRGLRAPVLGDARTAEELGRSFPSTRVVVSSGDHVVAEVPDRPALVVATPGAEPVAAGGYAAVLLLDTWVPLARGDLRTEEQALRSWMNAAARVAPGGHVVVVGEAERAVVQALVRWDAPGFARREAAVRAEAHLPPAVRVATITGGPGAVEDALTLLRLPEVAEVLGPVEADDDDVRAVLRVPRHLGPALSEALGELQRVRSARRLDPVRVQVDPATL